MAKAGEYRTDDLAMAVFLSLGGYDYTLENLSKTHAIWIFQVPEEREEDFDDMVGDYHDFEASVEPRKFVAKWTELRRELMQIVVRHKSSRPASAA